jgi:hypothetical protein
VQRKELQQKQLKIMHKVRSVSRHEMSSIGVDQCLYRFGFFSELLDHRTLSAQFGWRDGIK